MDIPELFRLFQQNCSHEWEFDENWRQELRFKHDALQIPEHCMLCGLEAWECWSAVYVLERENLDVLEYI